MQALADRGICKANQRELRQYTGMAFKTICPARDELVANGLIERIHHFRGRRDWYRIIPLPAVERKRERRQKEEEQKKTRAQLIADTTRVVPLFESSELVL
ncbi:MAG: hypothetical protein ACYDHD_12330 [Vulcanimicrobiaceae bacterium]